MKPDFQNGVFHPLRKNPHVGLNDYKEVTMVHNLFPKIARMN